MRFELYDPVPGEIVTLRTVIAMQGDSTCPHPAILVLCRRVSGWPDGRETIEHLCRVGGTTYQAREDCTRTYTLGELARYPGGEGA